jgi:hypothetical protein
MTDTAEPLVPLDFYDAERLWEAWAPTTAEDILARAAFENAMASAVGLDGDDDLYFRPGGWVVNLPATAARIACAAAVLAASFQLAGIDHVETEIIIAAAGFVAAMDLKPVKLGRQERRLADRLHRANLDGTPISAARARKELPEAFRTEVSIDDVADALDRLADAGFADRDGEHHWVLRAKGSEAWIRINLSGTT